MARDDFPKTVVDALAKRAAFICSNPGCRALTIAPIEGDDLLFDFFGVAAHICAAGVGGARYDADQAPEERSSAANGIFLCNNCATMIDKNKGTSYPIALLKGWKMDHEEWVRANLNKRQGQPHQTFNVSSYGQQGGITAGIVNIAPRRRGLNEENRAQLLGLLPDRTREVKIEALLNDSESVHFAGEVHNFLVAQGYKVIFHQIIPTNPALFPSCMVYSNNPDHYLIQIGRMP
jgi:hypothetical protein